MAHTPHTWTNGDTITAALLNTIETDLAAAPTATTMAAADTAVQAAAIQRANHTGTQTADTITDGTTNKTYTATEKTKLAGIAAGATANRADTATDGAIAAAIAGLVNGASTALDTLAEIDAQLAADEGSAAALAQTVAQKSLSLPVNAISSNGTAVIGARNSINASAGPVAVTMPAPTAVGQHMIIERADTSSTAANAITITGTIRGTANTVVTLAAVGAAYEGALYIAESLTSWAIAGSIKPRAVLDAAYDAKGAATTATAGLAPSASPAFTGIPTRAVGATQKPLRAGTYQPYLGPVSNRSRLPVATSVSITAYAEYMTWRLYKAADDIPAAALVYASFFGINEAGAAGITGTMQASIEYPVGTITRITFNAGTTGTIPTNGYVQSDLSPLAVTIPAGARFWVGSYVQWAGTGNVPRFQDGMYIQSGTSNAQATYARESHLGSATPGALTNTVMTGVRGANGGVSSKTGDSYGPSVVLGMTQRPTVFIAGDSEANMQVPPAITGQDSEGLQGVIEQIIGNRVGYINAACNSDQYSFANTTGQYTNRLALSNYCTHIIDEYGVNSIYGQVIATNITDFTTFRNKFPAAKPYLKTTVIPKVTGAWIKPDLSDQTPVTTLANFTAFNAFVRQGANGLIDGHIDLEDVTGYRDTGKVKPAQRYVTDASTTAASNIITSASAAFTVADIGKVICVIGAGASAANLIGVIATVTSATTCTIVAIDSSALTSGTAVTGAGCGIGLYTYDGTHQTRLREADIRDSVQAQRAVAPILAIG